MKNFPVMIVETNAAHRAGLAALLIDMGIPPDDIHGYGGFAEAKAAINKLRPRLLISEVGVEGHGGVELVAKLKLFDQPGRESVAVLVANSVAQTSWAKSRGSLADLVLSRPIPAEDMRTLLFKAVIGLLPERKLKASTQIEVAQKSIAEAVRKFDLARTLSYGIEDGKKVRAKVVALFERLLELKRHSEAYALARNALPHMKEFKERLDEIIRLAVLTRSFDDLPELHEFFVSQDRRSESATKAMYAALMVGGKHMIARGEFDRGYEFFLKAAITSGNHLPVLKEAVTKLLEVGRVVSAHGLLERFSASSRLLPEYKILRFSIDDRRLDDTEIIQRGWALMKAGLRDPRIHEIMIRRLLGRGKLDPAENLASEAARFWPEKQAFFEALVRTSPLPAPR